MNQTPRQNLVTSRKRRNRPLPRLEPLSLDRRRLDLTNRAPRMLPSTTMPESASKL